ncbi:MAG TPA: DUF2071 domain-containing protein, partial [Vicinamibacteria bacterium]|nr:DUF2071 domain-containing protein [Vicinamibacteria bacterium]
MLIAAGVSSERAAGAIDSLRKSGEIASRGALLELTGDGIRALLDAQAEIAATLDPDAPSPFRKDCPSIPWLTSIRTVWVEALSINYSVAPDALRAVIPSPLEPEIHKGRAWVQVLVSSLRDLRPEGVPSLFGVCFYQASYRAAVRYPSADGSWRRGGYFIRSETNHPVMRSVGNALAEFKFHDFGAAEMTMLRDGDRLTLGVDPEPPAWGGRLFGMFDTGASLDRPSGSMWSSLEELHEPLVECYDALGVDRQGGYLYILTIDRDPWRARWSHPTSFYCEYFETGELG